MRKSAMASIAYAADVIKGERTPACEPMEERTTSAGSLASQNNVRIYKEPNYHQIAKHRN